MSDEPKARWVPRVSKQARRTRERILEKAQQIRAEMNLPDDLRLSS